MPIKKDAKYYIIDNNYIPIFIEQDKESIDPSQINIKLIIDKSIMKKIYIFSIM